ncbi:MAG TPA: NADH-quinone oxidoreductase subunit L, partial [Ktedonobacteraceae bacterium]|nr:NADH-quinone oxidoreductase subunit L [Ktedonobacteraceae bacterium]
MINLTGWVLLFPLLGFIILGLTGRVMSRTAILTVAWGACGLAFLCAAISFLSMLGTPVNSRNSDQILYTWVVSGDFQLSFGLLFDQLSGIMLLVVTGVGLLIHIYSAGYMKGDDGFWRFFSFLNFFIFAMVLLVSADNFLFLLVGWGLVGLASFLLIGFWYRKRSAVEAARKAIVINVIGDFGLMIAIFLIFRQYTALNFYNNTSNGTIGVFNLLDTATRGHLLPTVIALLLFVACAAKSAQLPLYLWLPDAMEGPTPVSALIHAATMVTAGVYLVARAHPLFELAPQALNVIAAIGGLTAIFAASIALFQLDIKRVLAYSTISQLGYMFMSEGVSNYSAGIFHLTTHAYFKALLFMGAGAVIYALAGEQDMRAMGGLRKKLPVTFWTFLIAALAISGIPPFAGFWSKDEILSTLLYQASVTHRSLLYFLWFIGIITAGLTAFYMFRLVFGIFAGTYRGGTQVSHDSEEEGTEGQNGGAGLPYHEQKVGYNRLREVSPVMTIPLIILAVLSVIGGLVGSFSLFGASSWQPFTSFLAPVLAIAPEPSLSVQWISTGLSVLLGLLGILGAWLLYGKGFSYKENDNPLYQLVLHKYYIDEILDVLIVKPVL